MLGGRVDFDWVDWVTTNKVRLRLSQLLRKLLLSSCFSVQNSVDSLHKLTCRPESGWPASTFIPKSMPQPVVEEN